MSSDEVHLDAVVVATFWMIRISEVFFQAHRNCEAHPQAEVKAQP